MKRNACPQCGTSLDEVSFDPDCQHGSRVDPRLKALRASKAVREAKERHERNELMRTLDEEGKL